MQRTINYLNSFSIGYTTIYTLVRGLKVNDKAPAAFIKHVTLPRKKSAIKQPIFFLDGGSALKEVNQ